MLEFKPRDMLLTEKEIEDTIKQVKAGKYVFGGSMCPDVRLAISHRTLRKVVLELGRRTEDGFDAAGHLRSYVIPEDMWDALRRFALTRPNPIEVPTYAYCRICGTQLTWFTFHNVWKDGQYTRICTKCWLDRKDG